MPNPFARRYNQGNGNEPDEPEEEQEEEEFPVAVTERVDNELVEEVKKLTDLTQAQVDKLNTFVDRYDFGLGIAAGPLICRDGCGFKTVCPLYKENIHPVTHKCPIEGSLMLRWKKQWAESLGLDLDEKNDAFDMHLLDNLTMIGMLKHRALSEMSISAPEVAETFVAGYINDNPIEKHQLNPRIMLIERLGKYEMKLLNELLATRRDKFQVAGRADDLSRRHTEMLKKVDEVNKKHAEEIEVIDADFEVK